jgi:hypothetical protein
MARKRRPPKRKRRAPKNADALAQPIYVEDYYKPRGLGQVIQEPDVAAINNELVKKIWLLFEHYKIDPSDEHSWQELALSLALAPPWTESCEPTEETRSQTEVGDGTRR